MSAMTIDTTSVGTVFNKKTLKTLEFYVLILGALGPWLADWASTAIDNREALTANILAGAVFAAARGLGKMNADTKDFWQTTEFWAVVLASVAAGVGVAANTIGGPRWLQLQGLLAGVIAITNGLRKNPDLAAGNISALDLGDETDLFVEDVDQDPDADGDDGTLAAGQPKPGK